MARRARDAPAEEGCAMFEMKFAAEGGGLVAELSGRLDARPAPDFERDALAAADGLERERGMLLDLSRLEYISSAGLRSILLLARRLSGSGGRVVLCGMSGVVKEVFDISGFDSFLAVAVGRDEGLALISGRGA